MSDDKITPLFKGAAIVGPRDDYKTPQDVRELVADLVKRVEANNIQGLAVAWVSSNRESESDWASGDASSNTFTAAMATLWFRFMQARLSSL
jgi:hypothetical protein